jgi:hypothetical protein
MNHAHGTHRAREYFWFALALIVLLIGSAARAAGALSPVIVDADGVHYPNDSRRLEGDGFGHLALQVGVDHAT